MMLPTPMITAKEMAKYTVQEQLDYNKGKPNTLLNHFQLIENSLTEEFDTVTFCFTGMHRDLGIMNKGLFAYAVTKEGLVCARKTFKREQIELIKQQEVVDIRAEKKLLRDKLIIETETEEIQVLVNTVMLAFIVECLRNLLLEENSASL